MRKSLYSLAAALLLGSAVSASAYSYTVTPASGSTVEALTNVRIQSGDIDYFMMSWNLDPSGVTVTKDGVKVAGVQFKDDNIDYNAINLELEPVITEAGSYV
ncbi:MAG: hypothetical protein K2H14_09645, partial [Muribaculaceae bacterium]|nr:hypothetical protein [Muribaculaceae bacterium]